MKITNIQWCHSTINPVMGCDGCELWKPVSQIVARLVSFISLFQPPIAGVREKVALVIGDRTTSEVYRDREAIDAELVQKLGCRAFRDDFVEIIRQECKCYAGLLGTMRAGHKGYADKFEIPKLFPGRMAAAAKWGPPTSDENADKPWLEGMPRLTFISDTQGRTFVGQGPGQKPPHGKTVTFGRLAGGNSLVKHLDGVLVTPPLAVADPANNGAVGPSDIRTT